MSKQSIAVKIGHEMPLQRFAVFHAPGSDPTCNVPDHGGVAVAISEATEAGTSVTPAQVAAVSKAWAAFRLAAEVHTSSIATLGDAHMVLLYDPQIVTNYQRAASAIQSIQATLFGQVPQH